MKNIQCNTFLVGISISDETVNKEDELRMRHSLLDSESLKRELSRELGKSLCRELDLEIDFENPDIAMIFDLSSQPPRLKLQINPLFIYGRYKKLERGIFQSQRYCENCHGKGCEQCLFTGYKSEDTVETMITSQLVKAFEGEDTKFHGAGREDVDALMLGDGRPFVVEILKPRVRNADLEKLEKQINDKWEGKLEVTDLRPSSRNEMQQIKTGRFDKSYEASFSFSGTVEESDIDNIQEEVKGTEISQKTPLRVLQRRKNTTRKRMVKDLEILEIDSDAGTGRVRLTSESGFYVKEFMTGDQGRTKPNMKDLLGVCDLKVESLDVVRIHDEES